jgi:hypothetical protein
MELHCLKCGKFFRFEELSDEGACFGCAPANKGGNAHSLNGTATVQLVVAQQDFQPNQRPTSSRHTSS